MKEELINMQKELENIKADTFALEILKDYKAQNRRIFIVAMVELFIIILMMVGGFIFVTNYDFSYQETRTAETSGSGNACVGDECNNGESK